MPGPQLHPQYFVVKEAKSELETFVLEWAKRHDISLVEEAQILNECVANALKYQLRHERHPEDPDRKADEV